MTEPQRHPKKLPQEIYVRRRVAALAALLVLVVVLIVAAVALFGGKEEKAAPTAAETSTQAAAPTSSSAQPTTSTAAESSTTQAAESSSEAAASESESTPAEPSKAIDPARTTCDVNDLEIVASTSQDGFQPGDLPSFYMEAFNPTAADCQINLDEQKLRFEVYKMGSNERIWADTDCYPSVQTGELTFKSGETRRFQADWSRLRSAEGQCTDRAPAEPGHYFLHTVIGENYSDATPFNLY
ncbi:hypothetical protein [Corynebacterium sp.]|uniref:hypothetical protein n=1 Tax=Corynebacterium sp. TaxID=1720 RepID=UPI0026DA97BC|nr:hypothetical protein [Corynebacterium sp.]MDO5032238.1 hypothetical protein [Corynebacterium sp.]